MLRRVRPGRVGRGVEMGKGLRPPCAPFQVICVLVAAALVVAFSISPTRALQEQRAQQWRTCPYIAHQPDGERPNADTVAIVSGTLETINRTIAYDLSAVLDAGDQFCADRDEEAGRLSTAPAQSLDRLP
jgi:hypothetical protein